MSWTLCTSGAAYGKAGANASSTITTWSTGEDYMNEWSDEVEALINSETRYDWVANYASVGTNFQHALSAASSAMIANFIINYDMSGFTSRTEAQTMLDVNSDIYTRALGYLKDKENQEVMV